VDTNADPDEADYVIPGNDDAIRSCGLITRVIAQAINDGKQKVSARDFAKQENGAAPAPAPAPAGEGEGEPVEGASPAEAAPEADPAAVATEPAPGAAAEPSADAEAEPATEAAAEPAEDQANG